jgi:hypothetical protein
MRHVLPRPAAQGRPERHQLLLRGTRRGGRHRLLQMFVAHRLGPRLVARLAGSERYFLINRTKNQGSAATATLPASTSGKESPTSVESTGARLTLCNTAQSHQVRSFGEPDRIVVMRRRATNLMISGAYQKVYPKSSPPRGRVRIHEITEECRVRGAGGRARQSQGAKRVKWRAAISGSSTAGLAANMIGCRCWFVVRRL